MNLERWRQVDSLLDAALDRAPEGRAAFLRGACAGDEQLHGEVESLLVAHGQSEGFIEEAALDVAARLLAGGQNTLAAGTLVSHYEVRALLGTGGMGEVYLAHDTALDRPVALKLLPARLADEPESLRRFEREARGISKLNHPNILTIHEVGRVGAHHFIATEFIDGETLRRRIKAGPMRLGEVLDVALQATSALAAAHAAGVVHRDIKPENIMVRADGYVKVLDFGIAKINRPPQTGAGPEAATEHLFKTQAGLVVGTVNYMSPEQARGQEVDGRTDIWSLGCVLYEMCSGRVPFEGPTASDVIVSILEREPPALPNLAAGPAADFMRILSKALQKDRAQRYASAGDMALDLERLRQRLKSAPGPVGQDLLERPTALLETPPSPASTITRLSPATRETEPPPAGPARRRALFLVPVCAVLLLFAGVFFFVRHRQTAAPAPAPPAAPAAVQTERVLNYSLLVQKYRDGRPYQQPFKLGGEVVFEKDYQVRLYVSSPQEGHLYILNERPAPEGGAGATFNVLFPSPTANGGASRLGANQEIQIPGQSWFRFDGEEGTELVWLVWAAAEQPELEALKRFANTTDRGVVAGAQRAAVQQFLQAHTAAAPAVERDAARSETSVRARGAVLAHALKLQHY